MTDEEIAKLAEAFIVIGAECQKILDALADAVHGFLCAVSKIFEALQIQWREFCKLVLRIRPQRKADPVHRARAKSALLHLPVSVVARYAN